MRAICILALALATTTAAAGDNGPPKGAKWLKTIQEALAAQSRLRAPLVIFVYDAIYDDAKKMRASFESERVVRLLSHFACLYLCYAHDKNAYQQAYVPYLAPTPTTGFTPPLVTVCDAGGFPQKEYRVEGRAMDEEALALHLEGALRKLAPKHYLKAVAEWIAVAPLAHLPQRMRAAADAIAAAADSRDRKESQTALDEMKIVMKVLGKRLSRAFDDRSRPRAVTKAAKTLLKAAASAVKKAGGKGAREAVDALTRAAEEFDGVAGEAIGRLKTFWWCGRPGHPLLENEDRCPVCKRKTRRVEFDPSELWTCGEAGHPRYHGAHPGKCPVCGKELKRAADAEEQKKEKK